MRVYPDHGYASRQLLITTLARLSNVHATLHSAPGGITVQPMASMDAHPADWTTDLRLRVDQMIDEYRTSLLQCLDGLSEDEARLRLVPSKTTLLGLVKHVTYVEGVWFDQAVTGRSYAEVGIASTPDRSFTLRRSDTIISIRTDYRRRCDASRQAMSELASDTVVGGRGDRPVWALLLQVLRELAQHAGHADILREQVLARRPA